MFLFWMLIFESTLRIEETSVAVTENISTSLTILNSVDTRK